MWLSPTVERALFRWRKWRCSLIWQWMSQEYPQFSPGELNVLAKREIEKLGLDSIGFTFYWTCCLFSDFNLDYETSFTRIVIPPWWTQEFNRAFSVYASTGQRIVPPNLINERDRDFFLRQYGVETFSDGRGYVFLLSMHELNIVLDELKGRPRKRGRVGRKPIYPDRQAVACATLKYQGRGYPKIAEQVGLPDYLYPPEVVRHLVSRGTKLICECADLT